MKFPITFLSWNIVVLCIGRTQAQIPVTDIANGIQNTITASSHVLSYAEQALQYQQQIQQYVTQVKQFETQLENLKQLKASNWGDASASLNQLVGSINAANPTAVYQKYFGELRSLQGWSQTLPTASSFRQSKISGSDREMAAYGAAIQNLASQSENMTRDAANLSAMVKNAQSATGQLQALQAGAQLASAQAAQLSEIRALLIHLADATTARNASLANRESAQAAATEKSLKYDPSIYKGEVIDLSITPKK